jgi:hypothetical protein
VLHRLARSKDAPAKWILQASLAGCDPEAKDAAGWTALHVAAQRGRADAVEMLLESGANAAALAPGDKFGVRASMTPAYEALHAKLAGRLPCGARAGRPIFLAVICGRDALVERLFELGASLAMGGAPGLRAEPPLASAAIMKRKKSTFDLLMRLGAPLQELEKTNASARPLHVAAGSRDASYVEALLAKGVEVDSTTENGWSALHLAASVDDDDSASLLLKAGVGSGAKAERVEKFVRRWASRALRWPSISSVFAIGVFWFRLAPISSDRVKIFDDIFDRRANAQSHRRHSRQPPQAFLKRTQPRASAPSRARWLLYSAFF